jgi:hypothetical protein
MTWNMLKLLKCPCTDLVLCLHKDVGQVGLDSRPHNARYAATGSGSWSSLEVQAM